MMLQLHQGSPLVYGKAPTFLAALFLLSYCSILCVHALQQTPIADDNDTAFFQRKLQHSVESALKHRTLISKTGKLNVLVLLLRWSDHGSRALPSVDLYRNMFNAEGTSPDWGPTGSIANWVSSNSYGKLEIEATVVDWAITDNTEEFYADGRSAIPSQDPNEVDIEGAFHPLLDKLDGEGFDFSKFDNDNDGQMDITVVLHSGFAAEEVGVSCDGAQRLDRIVSFQSSADFQDRWVSSQAGQIRLGNFAVSAAVRHQGCINGSAPNIARLGVITHEFMHAFGLIDVYDTDGVPAGQTNVGGIAGFDIMANPGGQRFNKARCGFLSAYNKYEMGWSAPTEILGDGTYTLRPSELHDDVYKISKPYPEGEYLLIELRRPISFDEHFWGDGGTVIYHVDENVREGSDNGYRGYPGQVNSDSGKGWPENGDHYRVAVLQADGSYELEKATSNGGVEDIWLAGRTLQPGNGEAVATDNGVYPNTDSYMNGNIQVTGITIGNFQELDDGSQGMSFQVSGMGIAPTDSPTVFGETRAPTMAPVSPTETKAPTTSGAKPRASLSCSFLSIALGAAATMHL